MLSKSHATHSCPPSFLTQGSCWILADNQDLQPPDVIDSRVFGPLELRNIIGRWDRLKERRWRTMADSTRRLMPTFLSHIPYTYDRVLYAARSSVDHGPVENSEEAMRSDVCVLEAELDVDQIWPDSEA